MKRDRERKGRKKSAKRIRTLLFNVRVHFKVRVLKEKLRGYRNRLSVFGEIEESGFDELSGTAELLENSEKYKDVSAEFRSLRGEIERHNLRVTELASLMDSYIALSAKDRILNNLDEYPPDRIAEMNAVAKETVSYSIPRSFIYRKRYLEYVSDIGDVAENYDAIAEQRELTERIRSMTVLTGESYIDAEEADRLISGINELTGRLREYRRQYYVPPEFDESAVDDNNRRYVDSHMDDPVFDDVNGLSLDSEQRRAILCGSRSNLTVAGAGAGKTLTICGKVKWLLEREGVKEDEILLLSYSRASAEELRERVCGIGKNLTASTFHSLGLEILTAASGEKKVVDGQFDKHLFDYFNDELKKDSAAAERLFRFYSLYQYPRVLDERTYRTTGEKYEDLKAKDFVTLKDRLKKVSGEDGRRMTVKNELVKSNEELVIANWLFINGVRYEYEKPYRIKTGTAARRQYMPDFYLPGYDIYIEHYGVNREGKCPMYSQAEEAEYIRGMQWKRDTHKNNGTVCLETYSYEFSEGTVLDNLKAKLEEHGVKMEFISKETMINAMNMIFRGQEMTSLTRLISTFVQLYKSVFTDNSHFDTLKNTKFGNGYERNRACLFLDICKGFYDYYVGTIRGRDEIDFDDMILQSAGALDSLDGFRYRHIIVDEFQDISQSRKNLLLKLMEHGKSKLFAVGDDWQAIYRFAGCDINVFLRFDDIFPDPKKNFITTTHRNSSDLQAVAEPFITANPEQFKKEMKSELRQENPVRIVYHCNDRKGAFEKAVGEIAEKDVKAKILVLGRNNHDIDPVLRGSIRRENGRIVCPDWPRTEITYKTVHQSKGLESDYVILISGEDARNGFPNKMEDDWLIRLVLGSEDSCEFAEERRLFYVALTRTRSVVYVLSDYMRRSVFVREIEKRATVESLYGVPDKPEDIHTCPRCKSGRLVLRREKNGHGYFYGCSNYPYCDYTIGDLEAVERNRRCPYCGDFMVRKYGRHGPFYGCHNYPRCRFVVKIRG